MAERDSWYNGYDWKTREKKLKKANALIANGLLEKAKGPCGLCGDPDVPVEYHDEDYSEPYLWEAPALFSLCRNCHRDKLHKRFSRPPAWTAFLAHVRRGGYARDLKEDSSIKNEVMELQKALERGEAAYPLPFLRAYTAVVGEEWFANLRLDIECLKDPSARPRP